MTEQPPIEAALSDPQLLGGAFGDLATWATWRAVLIAAFGGKLVRSQRRAFAAVAGKRKPPSRRVAELWAVAGRRSGKSRIAAAIAAYIALFIDHSRKLAAGEAGYVLVLAPSRAQASLVFSYIEAFLRTNPMLAGQIVSATTDEIELQGNVVIAVHSNSFRTVRGRTLLACVFDETAFWRDETTANPDVETYRAVLPALATTGGMLVGISSPYRRSGLLFERFRDHFDKSDDDVLVVRGPSLRFNPTLDRSVIERARKSDPVGAASEWDAEFRDDISGFVSREIIEAAVEPGVRERAPERGVIYAGFFDAAGGSVGGDSMTMAIAHAAGGKLILDVAIERPPPFSPDAVAAEFAAVFKRYGVSFAEGDKWGGTWPAEALRRHGVGYRVAERTRSEIYLDLLPELNSGRVCLLDDPRLVMQLAALERRAMRGGRDAIDHPVGGHDDLMNASAGALVSFISLNQAQAWIEHVGQLAERAQQAPKLQDDDEGPKHPKQHPFQPQALVGNPFSDVYFATIARLQGRTVALQAPKCSFCGAATVGRRLTDGVKAWCGDACHQKWIAACSEQIRKRQTR